MKKKKKVPFPQADNLETIYSLFFEIGPDGLTKDDVVGKYGLDTDRQGDYYLNALMYIGLVEKFGIRFFLNTKGAKLRLESSNNIRNLFCEAVLEHDFLGPVYSESRKIGASERRSYVAGRIFNEYGLDHSTSERRATSICSWFDWIDSNRGKDSYE